MITEFHKQGIEPNANANAKEYYILFSLCVVIISKFLKVDLKNFILEETCTIDF